jgi:SP family sugar:H+ symporter-like MFS transporter
MITIGILVSNLINYGVREIEDQDASWRIVIGLGIAFSLPLGIGVLFSPESPRWLAGRDRWEDARMSLARFRGLKNDPNNQLVEDDFGEMYDSIKQQKSAGVGSWLECFTGSGNNPRVVYRTFLGLGIQFLQQWTGVNYFFYVSSLVSPLPLRPADSSHSTELPFSRLRVSMTPSWSSSFLEQSTSLQPSLAYTSSRGSVAVSH